MDLVIVESPAKARTISKFLGKKYQVKASMGHLVDLPKSRLGIDPENEFKAKYITIRGKGKILKELKDAGKKAKNIFLATDPDREGEAISWHLSNSLGLPADTPCRIKFHEITKPAIKSAFTNPQPLNLNKIEAQQARRILDRLVGYLISPLLWDRVRKGLSAGRVQSVAVRLICDREREIQAFIPEEYWTITGVLKGPSSSDFFEAKFFGKSKKIKLTAESQVKELLKHLDGCSYIVKKVTVRERKRNPLPPFTTSSLQQDAFTKLGFATKKTMFLAQQLYEGIEIGPKKEALGLITYMRTDATRTSPLAREEARKYVTEKFGDKFLPPKSRTFTSPKGAQEAHEAIRPTSVFREPSQMKQFLKRDQHRLYKLIWERFVSSQMAAALFEQIRADIAAGDYLFKASGSKLKFAGFTVIYHDKMDKDKSIPHLKEGQVLELQTLLPEQHFTQPPARYTEASLVKALENKGIGRPSTYSPIIETVQGRGYVLREGKTFRPTELGFIIVDIMKQFFPEVIDIDFTAQLENMLDKVESGQYSGLRLLKDFYEPFQNRLRIATEKMEKIGLEDEVTEEVCPLCGKNLVKKYGRYGVFLACPGFPECRFTMKPRANTGVGCPMCKGEIVERRTKRGKLFFGCSNYPDCTFVSWDRPVDKKCPKCGHIMIEKKVRGGTTVRCSNKECDYQETEEMEDK
ncbi:MAG TPA: type I DNA topoisomerase [Firmicutes bacterium]|jgi:DNA topoisomerase-1|nr:type I DNA topoisomerase [Bacillota bacterium]